MIKREQRTANIHLNITKERFDQVGQRFKLRMTRILVNLRM